jgi:transcription antitermination factor NusG
MAANDYKHVVVCRTKSYPKLVLMQMDIEAHEWRAIREMMDHITTIADDHNGFMSHQVILYSR